MIIHATISSIWRWVISPMRKRGLAILVVGIGGMLIGVLGIGGMAWSEEGGHAHLFTLPTLHGPRVSLDEYRGQVVLINFWATWCRDCAKEMPEFEKLYRKYQGKGLAVLAIALDQEGQPAVDAFLQKEDLQLSYPILLDPNGRVARAYRLAWVPVTIMVGRDGKIIETVLGARPWSSKEVMNSFEQLLNK